MKPELLFHDCQIANHGQRRIRLCTSTTQGLSIAGSGILVETHTELRRTLEHMKQLAERQPQQRDDDRGRVENGEEVVRTIAVRPCAESREDRTAALTLF